VKSIFLADGENHVRAALNLLIKYQPDMVISGEAENAENLLAQVCADPPDVILLDWNLPGIRPQKLVQTLREFCARTMIVVVSVKPEHERAAKELELDGFILKQLPPELFITSLERIISKPTDFE
jgi:two-component system, NarL family, response regulator DesR